MSNDSSTNERLQKLLIAQSAGNLTAAQHDELVELLKTSDAALEEYVAAMLLDTSLQREFSSPVAGESTVRALLAAAGEASPESTTVDPPTLRRRLQQRFADPRSISLTVATIVIGLIITTMALLAPPFYDALTQRSAPEPRYEPPEIIAKLSAARDVRWVNDRGGLAIGAYLTVGRRMQVEHGQAEVTFLDGTRCILTGPCDVTLGEAQVQLSAGMLAADVSRGDTGFRVNTPERAVVDLGTRFGVQVHEDGGEEVHVYDGVVEVLWDFDNGTSQRRQRLHAGESLSFPPDQIDGIPGQAVEEQFVFRMPSEETQAAAYWRFGSNGVVEQSSGQRGSLHGGARINDAMLLLDGGNSHVLLPDPTSGLHVDVSYTISLWVRPDKVIAQNIFVRTDEAGPAEEYSQQLLMDDSGHFVHYAHTGKRWWIIGRTVAQPGKWYHVAYSGRLGGKMKLYVNGVEEAASKEAVPYLQEGLNAFCVGGTSNDTWGSEMRPALTGSVKKVSVYNVELSPEEVLELYRTTREED